MFEFDFDHFLGPLASFVVIVVLATYAFLTYRRAKALADAYAKAFTTASPLADSPPVTFQYLNAKFDDARVRRIVYVAIAALAEVWPKESVYGALNGVRIVVQDTPSWVDPYGRKVAGLSLYNGDIWVGSDMDALCHEFAHRVESKLDRIEDAQHQGWTEKGISEAIAKYHAALKNG